MRVEAGNNPLLLPRAFSTKDVPEEVSSGFGGGLARVGGMKVEEEMFDDLVIICLSRIRAQLSSLVS